MTMIIIMMRIKCFLSPISYSLNDSPEMFLIFNLFNGHYNKDLFFLYSISFSLAFSYLFYQNLFFLSLAIQSFQCSVVSDSSTPWTAALQASLSFTVSWSLLKLMSIELVMLSNHCILCCPLLLLPSVFPRIRAFASESNLHIRWPKYWRNPS